MGQTKVAAWSQRARVSAPVGLGLCFLKGTLFRSAAAALLLRAGLLHRTALLLRISQDALMKRFSRVSWKQERGQRSSHRAWQLSARISSAFSSWKRIPGQMVICSLLSCSPHEGWGNLRCLSAQFHLYLETKLGGSLNLLLNASGNSKGEKRSIAPHMGKHLILLTQLGSEGPSHPPISCIFLSASPAISSYSYTYFRS